MAAPDAGSRAAKSKLFCSRVGVPGREVGLRSCDALGIRLLPSARFVRKGKFQDEWCDAAWPAGPVDGPVLLTLGGGIWRDVGRLRGSLVDLRAGPTEDARG